MALETAGSVGAQWLWNEFGKELVSKGLGQLQERWRQFHWSEAEIRYRSRMVEQHSTTRLLGHPEPINIDKIYTDVYVLNTITAHKRYDLNELQKKPFARDTLQLEQPRHSAMYIVDQNDRLYILGKPGAGKTTFLKYLVLQACTGKITTRIQKTIKVKQKKSVKTSTLVATTPVFVSLKEWADTNLELMEYIIKQFEICGFPDPKAFIMGLLLNGNALILFDGLDEVNQEKEKRSQIIRTINDFVNMYPETKVCLTCRIAANEYAFSRFTYIELADFDEMQIKTFAEKWYEQDKAKSGRFFTEFEKPEHKGLKELARTPLLLALLCLAFDETLSFPSRRVDLYRDALEALLRKWDSSRLIKRDIIYRNLSPRRKEQLLGRLAAQSFDAGVYFIRQETLAGQIIKYLQELPGFDSFDVLDGDAVLTAIEAQHGILVERAQGIYSFSHLTFQEYLTAKYIVENAAQGTVNRLVSKYMSDSRWNEVFLSVASLLDKADFFFEEFINTIKNSILKEKDVKDIVQWAQRRAKLSKQPNALGRIVYIYSVFYRALCESDEPRLVRTLEYINQVIYEIDPVIAKNARYSVDTALKIKHELRVGHPRYLPMIEERMYARLEDIISSIGGEFKKRDLSITEFVNSNYMNKIDRYLRENILLMECLRLSSVSNREKIVDMILKV